MLINYISTIYPQTSIIVNKYTSITLKQALTFNRKHRKARNAKAFDRVFAYVLLGRLGDDKSVSCSFSLQLVTRVVEDFLFDDEQIILLRTNCAVSSNAI